MIICHGKQQKSMENISKNGNKNSIKSIDDLYTLAVPAETVLFSV